MNIFLDDIRNAPIDFVRTYTVEETINLLKENRVNILSLDNDLGLNELEGRKVMDWIEEQFYTNSNFQLPQRIIVHSANASARVYMEKIIKKLYV